VVEPRGDVGERASREGIGGAEDVVTPALNLAGWPSRDLRRGFQAKPKSSGSEVAAHTPSMTVAATHWSGVPSRGFKLAYMSSRSKRCSRKMSHPMQVKKNMMPTAAPWPKAVSRMDAGMRGVTRR